MTWTWDIDFWIAAAPPAAALALALAGLAVLLARRARRVAWARVASWLRPRLPTAPDLALLLGVAWLAYGAGQVYAPAGHLVGGIFLLGVGYFQHRAASHVRRGAAQRTETRE